MVNFVLFIRSRVKADPQVVSKIHTGCNLFTLTTLNLIVQVKSKNPLNRNQFLEA